MNPRSELDELLSEDLTAVTRREQTAFDAATAPLNRELVLFGSGGLGRRTLAGLKKLRIPVLAFADNNPAAWNTVIDGVPVLSPQDAARLYASRAVFVVTIWRAGGTHRYAQFREQLLKLGCQKVVSFGLLYWKYPEAFLPFYAQELPSKIVPQIPDVRRAIDLWADDYSRRQYIDQVRFRMRLDWDGLSHPIAGDQYFPDDLFRWRPDEVFVDCGAFDGDTVKTIVRREGDHFSRIIAMEPDPMNFGKLQSYCEALPPETRAKVTLSPLAAASKPGTLRFDATGTAGSAGGSGSLEVRCEPLDALLKDEIPTFLKMDIEGAEPDALLGARETILRHRPLLALCVYHEQNHLWRIPLWVDSLGPGYRYFLRPHNEECWDLIFYAVPQERVII